MHGSLVLAAVLVVAAADVSHLGYHYKVPQTSYGVPSYQYGASNGAQLKNSRGQYLGSTFGYGYGGDVSPSASFDNAYYSRYRNGLSDGNNYQTVTSAPSLTKYYETVSSTPRFGGPYVQTVTSAPVVSKYYQTVTGSPSFGKYYESVTPSSVGQQTYQYVTPSPAVPLYIDTESQYANQYQTKYEQPQIIQSQEPAQVFKHFYVHSAPEEPEVPKPRSPIVVPPPQKHYKIIFVKTPNVSSRTSQIVPVQPQNEEKTIVYVLVKKPEEQQEVIVPKVEQKPPSKPEVYFIKYNNKEEPQAVINNIVSDYSKDGQTVSVVSGAGAQDSPVYADTGFAGESVYPTGSTVNIPSGTVFGSGSGLSSTGFGSGSGLSGSGFGSGSSFSSGSAFPNRSGYSGTVFPSSSISGGSVFPSSSGISSSSVFPSGSGISSGSVFPSSSGISGGSVFPSSSGSGLSSGSVYSSGSGSSGSGSGFLSGFPSGSSASVISGSNTPLNTFTVTSTPAGSLSVADSGAAGSSANLATASPIGSTTTSSIVYDDLNTISTSQGIPHETYGPPKFRAN